MTLKRFFDFFFAFVLIVLLLVPACIIGVLIRLTSEGPALYWSDRVGKNNIIFKMPKFRTMIIHTPPLATHLLSRPNDFMTPLGSFLRKYSLDEIPQLFTILSGEMTFVGPRPALFNQYDLIKMREIAGINTLSPGLTGWAQVNGRDQLNLREKVDLEVYYMRNQSFLFDLKILWMTFVSVLSKQGISH